MVHSVVAIINHVKAMEFALDFLGLHHREVQGFDLVQRFRKHRHLCGLECDRVEHAPDQLNMSTHVGAMAVGKSVSFAPLLTSVKLDLSKPFAENLAGAEVRPISNQQKIVKLNFSSAT